MSVWMCIYVWMYLCMDVWMYVGMCICVCKMSGVVVLCVWFRGEYERPLFCSDEQASETRQILCKVRQSGKVMHPL
jgi:hypothetical protein